MHSSNFRFNVGISPGRIFHHEVTKTRTSLHKNGSAFLVPSWLRAQSVFLCVAMLVLTTNPVRAADASNNDEPWLKPYEGPTRNDIDATTLDGKVLCGYQGWFNTPGDGTRFGFSHWGSGFD